MSAAKILGGLAFVILGTILLVLSFAPIPGLETICLTTRLYSYISSLFTISTFDISEITGPSGYIYIAAIIPIVAIHYIRAGIKSMRYDKEKKTYYISETKIGLLIAGFIIICTAFVFLVLIIFDLLSPQFQFIVNWTPIFLSYPGLLPYLLIPTILTLLIIFFTYWIGSKIMKKGVKKEVMF